MTTNFPPDVSATHNSSTNPAEPTAGSLLREARLHSGMHLAVLSVTLKVPIRELEALEANELDMSKGPAFYRALSASICRHLRVDPANILALLPPATGLLTPTRKAASPVVSPSNFHIDNSAAAKKPFNKVFWGAVSMLVLIGALLWVPSPNQLPWLDRVRVLLTAQFMNLTVGPTTQSSTTLNEFDYETKPLLSHVADALSDASFDEDPPTVNSTDTEAAATLEVGGTVNHLSVEASDTPATVAGSADAALADANLNRVPEAAVPAADASKTGPEWVFSATDDSWLEVRNAQRDIVWSGTINSDTIARVQSPLPVTVIVGKAEVVTVSFRGQPFDLKPHTKVTVARFKVEE